MPEISESEYRSFVAFQQLGSVEDIRKKVTDLEADNKKQRDELRDASEKLKQLPPEGAVILTGEDATAWPALKEFGKPEEVKARLDQATKDAADLAERVRMDAIRGAAEAAGYKPSVLAKLPGADGLAFEVREETVRDADGKETKANVAYVTGPDEGAKPVKLSEHADAAWKDFLPALKQENGGPGNQGGGTPYPPQGGDGAPPKAAGVQAMIEANRKAATAPNPLRPAKS